jgi:molybdenum cofactor cytidylyltransferase
MGRNKQLLPIGGETVIRRTARIILEACPYVIVVTGSESGDVAAALEGLIGAVIVENPDWEAGMVGSAQAGVAQLRSRIQSGQAVEAFLIHHGDLPFVDSGVFSALAAAWDNLGPSEKIALAAARDGRGGHPVLFPASRMQKLLDLGAGERLKSVLEDGGFSLVETSCDGVLEDIDTPEAYGFLLEKYGFAGTAGVGGPA